jgi:hypothetical protein
MALPIGILFSVVGLLDTDSPFAQAGIFALSFIAAILLRRHWELVRAWTGEADDWLFDRPVISVGLYVLIGVLLSLGMGASLAHMAFGGALWGGGGWWRVSRDRRLRGDAAT